MVVGVEITCWWLISTECRSGNNTGNYSIIEAHTMKILEIYSFIPYWQRLGHIGAVCPLLVFICFSIAHFLSYRKPYGIADSWCSARRLKQTIPGVPRRNLDVHITWTPKVCRIIAFWVVFGCLGLLFYILLGFRYT